MGKKKGGSQKTNTNIVKAKDLFSDAVHKDGAQWQYHTNLAECCHVLGFHREASAAFLKGVKLRAGSEFARKRDGGAKADLEKKIKQITAQYQLELEEQKEKFVIEAKQLEKDKAHLSNEVYSLRDKLNESMKKIQALQHNSQKNAAALQKATEAQNKAEIERLQNEKQKYESQVEQEKKHLEQTQDAVKAAEDQLQDLQDRMQKNKESLGITEESINNFKNTVSIGFAATYDDGENSDDDPEEKK